MVAEDKEGAIASARRAWREWLQDEDEDGDGREDSDEAEVVKVYRNSWLGEIA
ncbi:hypothetical protein BDIM_30240 [Brevundimonas diminuta ATCC 11568]|nr:hypothetical protein BDIM_30240 [Brevundimonas diminuta ATCC 11568]